MRSAFTAQLFALLMSCFAQLPCYAQSNRNDQIGEGGNTMGYDMAPETTIGVVNEAVKELGPIAAQGLFDTTWASLRNNYRVPRWFVGAKFGIFMHWGVYSVPAHQSEWYEKHMYGSSDVIRWHTEHFGPPARFGYKDFIPLFTQQLFDADMWAALFKESGARFVIPTAQHHDNFALWESNVTPINAKRMGPKRDLIYELAGAVRKAGLKFGLSNHGIENFQFINPNKELLLQLREQKADLFDPRWVDFYHVADRSDSACKRFLIDWYRRNVELIDKFRPDLLWFDNGVDQRYLDPLKLRIAAYYYNRGKQWDKEVSLSTKKAAFAPSGTNVETIGSILDFEGKIPPGIRTGVWQVDSKIGSTWGYTTEMKVSSPAGVISTLADIVSKNGTLLLNISPRADGTIPPEQQETLRKVGAWLKVNGEAIYDTHNWHVFKDDSNLPLKIRFTAKGNSVYAILIGKWHAGSVTFDLGTDPPPVGAKGINDVNVKTVNLLGSAQKLRFTQVLTRLTVELPATPPCEHAYVLKMTGLSVNLPTDTPSGNPVGRL